MARKPKPIVLPWHYTGLPEGLPLNPLQVLIDPIKDDSCNKIITAPTASGKTAGIIMSGFKHLMDCKKVLYVGIMKALVEEKRDDWERDDHPWSELEHATVTGDFKWTSDQQQACLDADIIVATPEALTARMQVKDNHGWLCDVGMVVWDEAHLVCAEGRGAAYESCIMQFNELVPDAENLVLSATIPNATDFAEWFEHLNGKKTELVKSTYRPVPIETHFMTYAGKSTADSEDERIDMVVRLVEDSPKEQFMVCVWKKSFGRKIEARLKECGVVAQFHNADKARYERKQIEKNFREGRTRVIINTTTLTTGVNLPATNVVLTAVTAGMKDIAAYELTQAGGRAGRPQYDTLGRNYIFIPWHKRDYHKHRIVRGEPILSQYRFNDVILLALLIEVYMHRITDGLSFERWYRRSLADVHTPQTPTALRERYKSMVASLKTYGCLKNATDELIITKRGTIVAQMQLSPIAFGVMVMKVNQISGLPRRTDINWIEAFGDNPLFNSWIDKQGTAYVPDIIQRNVTKECWKAATCIQSRMNAEKTPGLFTSDNYLVWQAMQRYGMALERLRQETYAFQNLEEGELMIAILRVVKSCTASRAKLYATQFTIAEQRKLCSVQLCTRCCAKLYATQFTIAEQRKLHRLGLYSKEDCQAEPHLAAHALSKKRMQELRIGRKSA